MQFTKARPRLGMGIHNVRFEGVVERPNSRFQKPALVWSFANDQGIIEVMSGVFPAEGNVAGDMLTVVTGASISQTVESDTAIGLEFVAMIEQIGDRRVTTITSPTGANVTTGNGGAGFGTSADQKASRPCRCGSDQELMS